MSFKRLGMSTSEKRAYSSARFVNKYVSDCFVLTTGE